MKKMANGLLVAGIASLALAGSASAAQLMNETFTYPNGTLTVVAPSWVAHSGAGAKAIQVNGGVVRIDQSTGSGEDVNRVFGAQPAGAKTYASFDLTVPTATFSGNAYFAHFKDSGTTLFRSRVFVVSAVGGYQIALDNSGIAPSPDAFWPTTLNFGQTYKIAISYNGVNGDAELWVDPVLETSPKILSNDGTGAGTLIESFALRQATPTSGQVFQDVDNIKVGTTFADVIDQGTSTNNASWARIKQLYR